jgi:hypothetical protein
LAVTKYKNTADNLQKKSFRIETLLDEARKEVEDLRTAKSNLLLDLETQQSQSATEIEMLEASNDQLRLELEVCSLSPSCSGSCPLPARPFSLSSLPLFTHSVVLPYPPPLPH